MFHPSYSNDVYENGQKNGNQLDFIRGNDKGYCNVSKMVIRNDGKLKQKKVDLYASGCIGNHIRDAETGQYYSHIVGSADEDLYFKVSYATGQLNNSNGSNTLFYLSPRQFMSHLNEDIDQDTIGLWEEKKNMRLKWIETHKKSKNQQ